MTEIKKMKLSEIILSQFHATTANLLLDFGEYISSLKDDYIIFMARKSLRLYDILLKCGIPPSEKFILSDRVLDHSNKLFLNKSVALIDDTLIAGTTLGKATLTLLESGAKTVNSHVFCADKKWWSEDIIKPKKIFKEFNNEEMLTFCACEINALCITPMPYLVDYPIFSSIRIRESNIDTFFSNPSWTPYKLSNNFHEKHSVYLYTFLPTSDTLDNICGGIGKAIFSLLDIIKIRCYGRIVDKILWLQIIPIVTLKPLSIDVSNSILELFLEAIEDELRIKLSKFTSLLLTPISRIRLNQYILSIIVGELFIKSLQQFSDKSILSNVDNEEAIRHYGPWLQKEIGVIGKQSFPTIFNNKKLKRLSPNSLKASELPNNIQDISRKEFFEYTEKIKNGAKCNVSLSEKNILTDFISLFHGLHHKYEIPARIEAKNLGKQIFFVDPQRAPNRNRLNIGFAWNYIVKLICGEYGLKVDWKTSSLLSLLLDFIIDLGIAVPIFSEVENVIFRAYRHGEDVLISDQEYYLVQRSLEGYFESSGLKSINKTIFEKLLVSLLRIGSSRDFLKIIFGATGNEEVIRVGYHIHGAVAITPKRNDEYLADNVSSWISKKLVERNIIIENCDNKEYELGDLIEASTISQKASSEAFQVGNLIGFLSQIKNKKSIIAKPGPLNTNNFILLTSCCSPSETTIALAAELNVIINWLSKICPKVKNLKFHNINQINTILDYIYQDDTAYSAILSTRLKYSGYVNNLPEKIYKDCYQYLSDIPATGSFLSEHWKSCWTPILQTGEGHESDTFTPWINRIIYSIYQLSIPVFLIKLGILSLKNKLSNHKKDFKYDAIRERAIGFYRNFHQYLNLDDRENKVLERMIQITQSNEFIDGKSAIEYAYQSYSLNIQTHISLLDDSRRIIHSNKKLNKKHSFSYLLWYDIIDSTGEKSGFTGKALMMYRKKIKAFKKSINTIINNTIILSAKDDATVYSWKGTTFSIDDEKHIFFSGKYSIRRAKNLCIALLRKAFSFQDIKLRILLISCNFANSIVYKHEYDPSVEGESFWEHLDRLRKTLKDKEREIYKNTSIIFICGDDPIKQFRFSTNFNVEVCLNDSIETSPDGFPIETKILGLSIF